MRLINADELHTIESHTPIGCEKLHGIQPRSTYQEMYERGWNNALKAAEKGMPTIDAVPVVRCQNCKHGYFAGTALYCDKQSRSHAWHKAAINWFCADGERRGEEG